MKDEEKKDIGLRDLTPILELLTQSEERLVKKIDEVITTVKIQNSRIGKCEDKIIERNVFCQDIQIEKERKVIRNRWIIGTLLVIIGILTGLFYKVEKAEQQPVPVQLIYKDTDSTYIFPNLFFRVPGKQAFTPIHEFFVDIENNKK